MLPCLPLHLTLICSETMLDSMYYRICSTPIVIVTYGVCLRIVFEALLFVSSVAICNFPVYC